MLEEGMVSEGMASPSPSHGAVLSLAHFTAACLWPHEDGIRHVRPRSGWTSQLVEPETIFSSNIYLC